MLKNPIVRLVLFFILTCLLTTFGGPVAFMGVLFAPIAAVMVTEHVDNRPALSILSWVAMFLAIFLGGYFNMVIHV